MSRWYVALFALSFFFLASAPPTGATTVQPCAGVLAWSFSPPLSEAWGRGNVTLQNTVALPCGWVGLINSYHCAGANGGTCAGATTSSLFMRIPYEGDCFAATASTGYGFVFHVTGGAAFVMEDTVVPVRAQGAGAITPTGGDRCSLASGVGPATFLYVLAN